jgi:hypothetical protein
MLHGKSFLLRQYLNLILLLILGIEIAYRKALIVCKIPRMA